MSGEGVELAAYLSGREDAARTELVGAVRRFEATQEAFQVQTNAKFASVDAEFASVRASFSELKGQLSSATTTLTLTVGIVGVLIAGAMLYSSVEAKGREPRGGV